MFYLKSDLLVQIQDLTDVATGLKVAGATVSMSIFEEVPLKLNTGPAVAAVQRVYPSSPVTDNRAYFDSGGVAAVEVGDKIQQNGTPANNALVQAVVLTSGAWVDGDAVGYLVLAAQNGDFANNDAIDVVDGQANIADIDGTPGTGGTFTLTFEGNPTAGIDGNASVAVIQTALRLVAGCASVDVTGESLATDPVGNGFYVTWPTAARAGAVPLLIVGIASLSGPKQVTPVEQTAGHLLGEARLLGGGEVGLPVKGHGLISGDYVYTLGTANYDKEEVLLAATSRNEIVITAANVAEAFTGREEVFLGIKGSGLPSIALNDDGGGDYSANLPDDLEKFIRSKRAMLLVTISKAGTDLVIAEKGISGFYTG